MFLLNPANLAHQKILNEIYVKKCSNNPNDRTRLGGCNYVIKRENINNPYDEKDNKPEPPKPEPPTPNPPPGPKPAPNPPPGPKPAPNPPPGPKPAPKPAPNPPAPKPAPNPPPGPKPAPKPAPNPPVNPSKKTDENDINLNSSFPATQTIKNGIKPLTPTINELSPELVAKAKLVNASHIMYSKGLNSAQEYLDNNHLKYTIDTELSNVQGLVVTDAEGKVSVIYRGTEKTNINDIYTDTRILFGIEQGTSHFNNAYIQMDQVISKYGKPSEIVGYSLGGNKAIYVGDKYNIQTTTFNPFLAKNVILNNTKTEHHIIRTTEDPVSIGLSIQNKTNWKVDTIYPHQDSLNPIESHMLENFTETSYRRPGMMETLLKAQYNQTKKLGELQLLNNISKAQNENKSFTQFITEYTPENINPLNSVLLENQQEIFNFWKLSNGQYTQEEFNKFNSSSNYDNILRNEYIQEYRNYSEGKRTSIVNNELNELIKMGNNTSELIKPYKSNIDYMKRVTHVGNIGVGLLAGYGSDLLLNKIIGNVDMNPYIKDAINGAVVNTSIDATGSLLAGSVMGVKGIASSAGAGAVGVVGGTAIGNLTTEELKKAGLSDLAAGTWGTFSGISSGTAITMATQNLINAGLSSSIFSSASSTALAETALLGGEIELMEMGTFLTTAALAETAAVETAEIAGGALVAGEVAGGIALGTVATAAAIILVPAVIGGLVFWLMNKDKYERPVLYLLPHTNKELDAKLAGDGVIGDIIRQANDNIRNNDYKNPDTGHDLITKYMEDAKTKIMQRIKDMGIEYPGFEPQFTAIQQNTDDSIKGKNFVIATDDKYYESVNKLIEVETYKFLNNKAENGDTLNEDNLNLLNYLKNIAVNDNEKLNEIVKQDTLTKEVEIYKVLNDKYENGDLLSEENVKLLNYLKNTARTENKNLNDVVNKDNQNKINRDREEQKKFEDNTYLQLHNGDKESLTEIRQHGNFVYNDGVGININDIELY